MKKILTALLPVGHRRRLGRSTADSPPRRHPAMRRKNTLPAIKLALENNAEAIWVTVQLSRDGVPMLYRSS